jgi:putative membrane protein
VPPSYPAASADAMSYLTQHWSFDPLLVVVGVTVAFHEAGLHDMARRSDPRRSRLRSLLFYSGLGVVLLAVASPVDYWGNAYFFVHMVEHILITFFAPILIVAGAPWFPLARGVPVRWRRWAEQAVLGGRLAAPLRTFGRFLVAPWTALVVFNLAMVLWHVPVLFDVAQRNRAVHVWLMHGSFLVAGILFWLQIVPSSPFVRRASTMWQIGAIISTNLVMLALAMSMSIFTASSWYSVYDHVAGVSLRPFADQQIGAAILWVCGDFWAVPALIFVVKQAIDDNGSFSEAIDSLLHLAAEPTLEELRTPVSQSRRDDGGDVVVPR